LTRAVDGMNWIDFPDGRFTVNGLAWWEETNPHLVRLPDRMKDAVPQSVWNLSRSPSGGRIRFATDATDLGIRLHYPSLEHMNNMPRVGQLGVDLWVDGEFWRPAYPNDENPDLEFLYFEGLPPQRREICLHLGLYAPVELQAIGLNERASIEAPAPFAVEKPVVFYGTSITQGGCATHPGTSYQALVGTALNVDFVNLGFSGAGKGETALARAVVEIDASCYVMDFCQNNGTAENLHEVYSPFLQTIRDTRPDTPIVCITTIFSTGEIFGGTTRHADMRTVIRNAVAERKQMGDQQITLVEGYDLLGPDDRIGLVDGSHPNDIGFLSMARGLEPVLRSVLRL
jgi:hypothetical protein